MTVSYNSVMLPQWKNPFILNYDEPRDNDGNFSLGRVRDSEIKESFDNQYYRNSGGGNNSGGGGNGCMLTLLFLCLAMFLGCWQSSNPNQESETPKTSKSQAPNYFISEKERIIAEKISLYRNSAKWGKPFEFPEAAIWIEEYLQKVEGEAKSKECKGLNAQELYSLYHSEDKPNWLRNKGFQWTSTDFKNYPDRFDFGRCRTSSSDYRHEVAYNISGDITPNTLLRVKNNIYSSRRAKDMDRLQEELKSLGEEYIYVFEIQHHLAGYSSNKDLQKQYAYRYKGLKWLFPNPKTLRASSEELIISAWDDDTEEKLKSVLKQYISPSH